MQDCAAAALDLVFPAGQPSQEAAYPLLHRRSASQAQVPGRLFPRPSPNGFSCVEVWAVARQIHQPQPQARPAQILPHRLATMGWGIIPDYLKRPKVPLAQLVQKGCRGSAVAVSLQFPPVSSIPPLLSPDTPPNSSWLSRHTADCWSSPGLALPAAPTGPATPHRHGSGPRRRRISWLRSLLPPLAFFCVFHLGFGLARCGPSRRGAGRRAQGELLPSDPWSASPPTLQQLEILPQLLQDRSPSWRTYSTQALRMYRLHVGKPELADLVWLPRHKKDA